MSGRRPTGANEEAAAGQPPEPLPPGSPREISDARTMRAIAHPLRLALMEALMREGPLTATQAAELLGDSPGNMSWHLQTLAKYGFVEEAGGGRGRSRPWRLASYSHNFDTTNIDAESSTAGDALESTFQERSYQRLREWWTTRRSYPLQWRKAAFSHDALTYMTAEEMQQLGDEIAELLRRYRERTRDKAKRPRDAQPVHLVAFGHPLTPTSSGN